MIEKETKVQAYRVTVACDCGGELKVCGNDGYRGGTIEYLCVKCDKRFKSSRNYPEIVYKEVESEKDTNRG